MIGAIRLLLQDGEFEKTYYGTVKDASPHGVKVRLNEKIPVRSRVYCNEEALGISGSASVRYCIFSHGKYEVGLEFFSGNRNFKRSSSVDP